MKLGKQLTALALCATLILGATACGAPGDSSISSEQPQQAAQDGSEPSPDGTVKLAAIYGFTGSGSQVADSCKKAIDLMADRINQTGIENFGGAKLEIVYGDNTSVEDVSKTTAERVLADEDILLAVGAGSSALLLPMLPVTEKLQVPILTNNSGNSITEQGYQFVFRTGDKIATAAEFKTDFLEWLRDDKGYDIDKIGILYVDYDFGISAADSAEENYSTVGTIIAKESFPADIADMSALVTKFKSADVQIIDFTGELQNAKLFFDTCKSMGYSPLVVGGGGGIAQLEFANGLGDDSIGIVTSCCFTFDQKNVQESELLSSIVEEYHQRYGIYPDENAMWALTQMLVAWDALENAAEPTRLAVRDAISGISTEGFTWNKPVTFDETGNNTGAGWVMAQWKKNDGGEYFLSAFYPEEASTSNWIDPRE